MKNWFSAEISTTEPEHQKLDPVAIGDNEKWFQTISNTTAVVALQWRFLELCLIIGRIAQSLRNGKQNRSSESVQNILSLKIY